MLWREPDGQPVALEWTGTSKRGGMRAAKAYARAFLEPGAIVELRATDAHGGIIERVELVARGLTAVRWRQAFET
jgi:ABC-type sugar transport system substrate-binding protein